MEGLSNLSVVFAFGGEQQHVGTLECASAAIPFVDERKEPIALLLIERDWVLLMAAPNGLLDQLGGLSGPHYFTTIPCGQRLVPLYAHYPI
jgi:hypothetical protein